MPPTIESTVADEMDRLFSLRKLVGSLQPMVRVGNHMTTITDCTTSAEKSRKIRDVVDSALSQGKDAFVLTEVMLGQNQPRKDAMCVRVHTRTRVRTFVQSFSGDSRDAMTELRTGGDDE